MFKLVGKVISVPMIIIFTVIFLLMPQHIYCELTGIAFTLLAICAVIAIISYTEKIVIPNFYKELAFAMVSFKKFGITFL